MTIAERVPEQTLIADTNLAIALYYPERVVTNEEIEGWGVTNGRGHLLMAKTIDKTVGSCQRYVANDAETPLLMGTKAAARALDRRRTLGALIVSSSHPQGFNLSSAISSELGVHSDVKLDVHAACSGFAHALSFIHQYESYFRNKRILIVCTEKYWPYLVDIKNEGLEKDPSMSQTIFSDGAAALLIEKYGTDLQIHTSISLHLPKEYDLCIKMAVDPNKMVGNYIEVPVPQSENGKLYQNGQMVRQALRENIQPLIAALLSQAKMNERDIRCVIPHQPSKVALGEIQSTLPSLQLFRDLQEGNWSSATIPKALQSALVTGQLASGDTVVMVGFGAGMFASASIVQMG